MTSRPAVTPIFPIPIDVGGEVLCIDILEEGSAPLPILDLAATVKPHLGSALGSRLDLMGQISLFNLATAITALHVGVPGRLTIEVPSRVGGRIEIDWQPARTTPK
jgi:hypothetical protein